MVGYDEQALVRQLEQLPDRLRAAFAAACAQRLLPAYIDFFERSGRGDPRELISTLECLWSDLLGDSVLRDEDLKRKLESCMSLIPREDDEA
jgi:uncharacterized protein YjaG (DUF416 family)